jgi:hypothetical protein
VIDKLLTERRIKVAVVWNVVPYCLLSTDCRFGAVYCLHHQGYLLNLLYYGRMNDTLPTKLYNRVKHSGSSRYTRFRYPRSYFSIMRSVNILFTAMIEAAATDHWLAPQFWLRGLKIKAFHCVSLWKIHRLSFFNFTCFRYERQLAGMQVPHISSVTCICLYHLWWPRKTNWRESKQHSHIYCT